MAGLDERVSIPIELQMGNLSSQLSQLGAQLAGVGKAGHDAGTHAAEGFGAVGEKMHELVGEVAGMVAAYFTLEKGIEAVIEGFKHADAVRDLHASLEAVSSSGGEAVTAFNNLYKAAEQSRATGHDLVQIYGQLLPTALNRGFSETQFQKWVAQVAKLAPALGQSVEQTMDQFQQILAGRVRKTNLLAQAIGLDPAAYTAGQQQLESVAANIDRLAEKGEKMGQSFASSFAKIKEGWLDAFAIGFNESRDGVTSGLDQLHKALADPALIGAIHDIGKAFAGWVPTVATAVSGIIQAVAGLPKVLAELKDDTAGNFSKFAYGEHMAGGIPIELINSMMLNGVQKAVDQYNQAKIEFGRTIAKSSQLPADVAGPKLPSLKEYVDGVAAGGKKWQEIDTTLEGIGTKTTVNGNAAIELAKKLKEIYDKTFDSLTKLGPEQETKMRAERNAIDQIFSSLDDSSVNFDAKKLAQAGIDVGGAWITAKGDVEAYGGALDAVAKKLPKPGSPGAPPELVSGPSEIEQERKRLELDAQAAKENAEVAVKGQQKINQSLQDTWRHIFDQYQKDVVEPMGNVFADVITNGAGNFGSILAEGFVASMRDKSKDLASILVDAVSGGTITKNQQGHYIYGGVDYGTDPNAAKIAQLQHSPLAGAVGTAVQAGGAFASSYQQKGQTDLGVASSALVGAAATVASMAAIYGSLAAIPVAGWIAAAVVAVAQVAGHLLQPSPSLDYKYIMALHTDDQGVAHGYANKNVDANELQGYLDTFTSTVDQFYNGYIKILLKFPNEILPKISASFQPVYGFFEQGADLGMAASSHFADELAQYLKTGLPHDIGDRFSTYIKSALVNMGLGAERFDAIWKELSNLDPAKAMQGVSDLTDAVIGFNKALAEFSTPTLEDVNHLNPLGGIFQQVQREAGLTFAQQLEESDADLVQFGSSLQDLIGPDQLAAAADLSRQMTDRYNKEKQFLQDISNQIDTITHSFQQQMQGYTLAGMTRTDAQGNVTPDYQAQAVYLQQQTQLLMDQLHNATSPEQITSLYNQIAANIDKIYQSGSQLGPEAEAAYRHWAETNLATAEQAAIARQHELAAQVDEANQAFINAIGGFIDAFLDATDAITGTTSDRPSWSSTHGGTGGSGGATPAAAPVPDENGHCPTGWVTSTDGKYCILDRSANRGTTRTTTGARGATITPFGADPATITAQSATTVVVPLGQTGQIVNLLSGIQDILAAGQNLRLQIVDDAGNDITPPSSAPGFRARASASR